MDNGQRSYVSKKSHIKTMDNGQWSYASKSQSLSNNNINKKSKKR